MVVSQHFLVIIGCGIEGLMTALLAAQRGLPDVLVFDAPDAKNLGADSQRNHAWLQSGLLYEGNNMVAARQMYFWGREMHRIVSLPIPQTGGIFRYSSEESAAGFCEKAKKLKMESSINRITDDAARKALGAFYLPKWHHFEVPDTPFNEADLMTLAKRQAQEYGVKFRKAKVELVREPRAPQGYLVKAGDELIEPMFLVLSAGAGLIDLLDQLGINHPLKVFRSALLRLRCGDILKTPLFVDNSTGQPTSGLSVVQHSSQVLPPDGCLVIGSRARQQLTPEEARAREVTPEEEQALQRMIPPQLLPPPSVRRPQRTSIAGHKTEALDSDGKPSVNVWIKTWPAEYPGLIAAIPGKATLGLFAAKQILDQLKSDEEGEAEAARQSSPSPAGGPTTSGADDFGDPFRCHFQDGGSTDELVEADLPHLKRVDKDL